MTRNRIVLEVGNLAIGYGSKVVSRGVSFSVGEGDYVVVVGSNGSGKTTLLKTLLGLTKPIGGSIRFAPDFRPGDIGYMPQVSPIQRDFPASVFEVVSSGIHTPALWFKSPEVACQAKGSPSFPTLSIGQRQKVMWARATASPRRLLMLDEPVAGLDIATAKELYAELKAMNMKGVPVLTVTHDLPNALEYATHVLEIGERPLFRTKEAWLEGHEGYCTVCGDGISGHHHHHGGGCKHGNV